MEDSWEKPNKHTTFFSLHISILDMNFQTPEANSLLKQTKTFSPFLTQALLMQMSKQWLIE